MKINKVGCEQFAGIQDREITFGDGLNILIGENESGKSTIVDLIYHLLFKSVKLDGRSDAEFIEQYFPKKVSGPQGDAIDGVLRFETASGKYKLSKEWEKGAGNCKLTLPDGTIIKSLSEIEKILAEELGYGAGVYGEIVFASQKRQQNVVESILKIMSKKKDDRLGLVRADLTATITQAALETGGVSLEKLESRLNNMLTLYGERWDMGADLPESGVKRGIENKWACATTKDAEAGKQAIILRAFYTIKEIEKKQSDAEAAEKKVEAFKVEIQTTAAEKRKVDEKRKRFQEFRSVIGQLSLLKAQIESQKVLLTEQKSVLVNWPDYEQKLRKAKELKGRQEQARIHDLYLKVEKIQKDYESEKSRLAGMKMVEASDIKAVQTLQREQTKLEGRITGLNLVAKVKQLGDVPVEIKTSSGELLLADSGELKIKEAVEIKVPGIMEMQLMPGDVDMNETRCQLQSIGERLEEIFERYQVESLEALQNQADAFAELQTLVKRLETMLESQLGELTWEELQKFNEKVAADIPTEAEVNVAIKDLCKTKSLEGFIGGLEITIEQYTNKYESMELLKESIQKIAEQIEQNCKKVDSIEDIPEEFQNIEDADRYNAELEETIEAFDTQLSKLGESLRLAESDLGEQSAEEYFDELMKAKADLEEKKVIFKHWRNIYEVFKQLKESTKGNPMQDIEEKFQEYLGLISDGGVTLTSMDDQMSVKLASGKHALTYEILSEGTKDTISLAFRLAMLEHLYPEGGGLAVFDDPFTDMDPKRVEQSCKLIQRYAERNQVIFITCDEKYGKMLAGNIIEVEKYNA